ncbi:MULTISPECIES: DUF3216 domain-containing protein [Thermococcus]|uniref:Methyltransferase n=1 Tax=Thermococcus barossii TaxID=54077 RepID=A0A2Z2MFZ3_9EURY|nr:DUF3216 domain-containing protein [Thermococcus barossii]ASJ04826.1 methyltransferase [Thermococcus barossii]NJE76889.1 DUF3216 domain-containing protein [Thermococcus sp. ES12]
MNVPEIEELKELCGELGETGLVGRIDSFVALNEGLESKKGKEFIEVSLLGFAEGILVSLMRKYPDDERVRSLLEKVRQRREELDVLFRKPRAPILDET